MIATPTPEVMHFSTDALPERDRMTIWREVFGRRMMKAEFEPVGGTAFRLETMFRSLPGLSLGFGDAAGFRSTRTQSLIADGNDDLMLSEMRVTPSVMTFRRRNGMLHRMGAIQRAGGGSAYCHHRTAKPRNRESR